MSRSIVTNQVLWSNAGTATLHASVPDGSVRYFVNDSSALSAAPTAANGWFRIPINGGDELKLQMTGRIISTTGVTGAVSTMNTTIVAIGLPYECEPPTATNALTHPALLIAPQTLAAPLPAAQLDCVLFGHQLIADTTPSLGGAKTLRHLASHGVVAINRGLYYPGVTPATGDAILWAYELGVATNRGVASFTTAGNSALALDTEGAMSLPFTVKGLDAVYISISHFVDFVTAAPTALLYRGILRAIVRGDIDERERVPYSKPSLPV